MDKMERLKKKRGTVRTSITKLMSKIDGLLIRQNPDTDKLEECFEQLNNKEECLNELDQDIEGQTEDDELEGEVESVMHYRDEICLRKTRIKRTIKKCVHDDDSESSVSSRRSQAVHRSYVVKLPKLVIDKFSGDISQWQGFWSQYETAIHNNETLGKVDKFNYLKSYLIGTAANVVACLTLNDDNYDNAIVMLKNRFGRKDLVINAHMNKLLNLNPVKKSTDIVTLRSFYDECEIQVRCLETMGVVSDSYGTLLCTILMKMMPEDLALEFSRLRGENDTLNVKDLLEFLQREIESRERTLYMTKSSASKEKDGQVNSWEIKSKKFSQSSAATLHATGWNEELKCVFCESSDHKTDDCTELTADERRQKLKNQGRCFVCLRTKHIARYCKVQGVWCEKCGKRHHTTICFQERQSKQLPMQQVKDAVITTAPSIMDKGTVLLQTATVLLETPVQSKIVRCLLDGGSQRSFIR